MLSGDAPVDFAPPKSGGYKQPNPPNLPLVKEPMELTICVSPEAGWSELEAFLGETKSSLTVAMYQFTAPHIFKAIEKAVTPGARKFELILHPVPEKPAKTGVKAHDLDEEEAVIEPLETSMKKRFEQTWATLFSKKNPKGLFASAYHIKVAVRDGNAFWLSSGNWQSSNQPNVHPFADDAGRAAGRLPAQLQPRLSRHHQERQARLDLRVLHQAGFRACAAQAANFAAPDDLAPSPIFSCPRRQRRRSRSQSRRSFSSRCG